MQPTVSSPLTRRRRFLALALSLAAVLTLLTGAATGLRAAGDDRVFFPGSYKAESATAKAATATGQAVTATDTVELQIALKMRDFAKVQARVNAGERIPQAEMEARYYPLAADYEAVARWARAQGFKVAGNDPHRLSVNVSGPAATAEKAFGTKYAHVAVEGQDYLAAQAVPSLPAKVAAPVLSINGLQPYLKVKRMSRSLKPQISNAPPYLINEILRAYGATNLGVDGTGQTIAILIDTFPLDSDVTAFWTRNSVPQKLSNLNKINVNNVSPLPDVEGEETLDVCWTSGIAPAAKINIYASGSLQFTAIDKALQRIAQDLRGGASIGQLSISLGLGELDLPPGESTTESQYYLTITNYGVSIFVSSGDDGSNFGGDNDDTLQVSYAASDPSVTGVGGTALFLNRSTGAVSSETVWNELSIGEGAGGGGISALFARPSYQQGPGVPAGNKRVVPDVSLVADPETGCFLIVNNKTVQFGGTSWSAPVWAGFTALINQARVNNGLLPIGLLNPQIYPLIGTNNFRDIVTGNNGAYSATVGYDATTGVGVPVVSNLLNTLTTGGRFSLTGFNPTSGSPGTEVTLTGSRLDRTVSVSFNGAGATFTPVSPVQLTAVVPAGATTGPITITDSTGTSVASTLSFTVLAPGAGANDPFSNALALGLPPVSVTGSNVNATSEPGEPLHAGKPGGASIWYKWTAPANGVYSFNTYGSSFDTLLAVYTGASVDALTEVASNDDAAGLGTASAVTFQAVTGTTYYVAVDGISAGDGGSPAEGTVVLNFTNTNDKPVITNFNPQRGGPGRSVRLFGGNFLAVNTVRFNGVPALFTTNSNTQITAIVPSAATTGLISVEDTSGNTATSVGTFTVVPTPTNDNFDAGRFVESVPAALNGTNTGASKQPGEPNHADNAGGQSVWFTWVAPADGAYTLNTLGSDFDTLLAVYTGASVDRLTEIASNDDGGPRGTSSLAFNAAAGTTYHFAVDGYNDADGSYNLNLQVANGTPAITAVQPNSGGPGVAVAIQGTGLTTTTSVKFNGTPATFRVDSDVQITAVVPNGATTGPITVTGLNGTAVSPTNIVVTPVPANDNFSNSQLLSGGAPIIVTGSNAGASKEPGEPQIIPGDDGGRSVWYSWTPPNSGDYVITTRGSDFDTILGVYTGSTVANLVPIVANDDDETGGVTSTVTLTAIRGTTYRIAVDGSGGDAGSITLSILTTTAIQPVYTSSFEEAEGFSTKGTLIGQGGWKAVLNADGSSVSGGNGIIGNQLPNLGQQAFVGSTPLLGGATALHAYHDLNYVVSAANPVVSFSTVLKITPSSNGRYDRFGFTAGSGADDSAREQNEGRYFSLIFDNADGRVLYQLNDGSAPVDTGVTFSNNAIYSLEAVLDFQANSWSATLNGVSLVDGQPISTTGPAQLLTRISADWTPTDPAAPGDNALIFDQYAVNAPTFAAPVITVQPASLTATSGDTVVFSVVATGTPPLLYQWYYAGQPIEGATNPTYTIDAVTPSNAGRYNVAVRNNYGTTTSLDSFLVVSTTQAQVSAIVTVAAQQKAILETGSQPGVFLFSRSGDVSQALTVDYNVGGSAAGGIDYKPLTGRFTFKAGQANKKVKVKPLDRGLRDGSQVKVTIKALVGNGYVVGGAAKDKIKIQRN